MLPRRSTQLVNVHFGTSGVPRALLRIQRPSQEAVSTRVSVGCTGDREADPPYFAFARSPVATSRAHALTRTSCVAGMVDPARDARYVIYASQGHRPRQQNDECSKSQGEGAVI